MSVDETLMCSFQVINLHDIWKQIRRSQWRGGGNRFYKGLCSAYFYWNNHNSRLDFTKKKKKQQFLNTYKLFCPPPQGVRKGGYWIRHRLSVHFVSKITQKVAGRFLPNYICRFFLPISRSSSHVSHFDLLSDLVYSGVEMSVSKTTQNAAVRFSLSYICRFFLPISKSSSHVTHFDLISKYDMPHFLYHAPGVAPYAKNSIILSRRGTLEVRVHWLHIEMV